MNKEPNADGVQRGEAPLDGTVEMVKLRVRDRSSTLKVAERARQRGHGGSSG